MIDDFFMVWFVLVIDVLAACVLLWLILFNGSSRTAPIWHRFGVLVICGGLIGQAARNVEYLATGVAPTLIEMPFWIFKDLGIAILAVFYFWRWGANKRSEAAEPPRGNEKAVRPQRRARCEARPRSRGPKPKRATGGSE